MRFGPRFFLFIACVVAGQEPPAQPGNYGGIAPGGAGYGVQSDPLITEQPPSVPQEVPPRSPPPLADPSIQDLGVDLYGLGDEWVSPEPAVTDPPPSPPLGGEAPVYHYDPSAYGGVSPPVGSTQTGDNNYQHDPLATFQEHPPMDLNIATAQEDGPDLVSKLQVATPLLLRKFSMECYYYFFLQSVSAANFLERHPPLAIFYTILIFVVVNFLAFCCQLKGLSSSSGAKVPSPPSKSSSANRPRGKRQKPTSGSTSVLASQGGFAPQGAESSTAHNAARLQEITSLQKMLQDSQAKYQLLEQKYVQLEQKVTQCEQSAAACSGKMQEGFKRGELILTSLSDMVSDLQGKTQDACVLIENFGKKGATLLGAEAR